MVEKSTKIYSDQKSSLVKMALDGVERWRLVLSGVGWCSMMLSGVEDARGG